MALSSSSSSGAKQPFQAEVSVVVASALNLSPVSAMAQVSPRSSWPFAGGHTGTYRTGSFFLYLCDYSEHD